MASSSNDDFRPRSKFPWTRYWHVTPAAETRQSSNEDRFIDEDSFLDLPANLLPELNRRQEAELFTLPELLSSPALVLLGRPGAGKSTEIEMASLSQPGVRLIQHRAKDYVGSAATLLAELDAQASSTGQPVRLVMDGTDELLLENAKFLNSLEAGLEQRRQAKGLAGIQIILSCRAAEWPEGKLAHLWPNQIKVARLCQLDQASARAYVTAHLDDRSDVFWAAVYSLRIVFLTIWPHSLHSLVESFVKNNGELPGTLFELVQQTAKWRCDVNYGDEERRTLYKQRSVPASKSYRLAARAAALGLFSGRRMLSLNSGLSEPGVVTANEFLAGVEPMQDGTLLQPETDDLKDLPRLAVFESVSGGKRLVFAHQLMREFLAASWLAERKVPLTQLICLFGYHREDGKWQHYPQHIATASWLASNLEQKPWRDFLIQNDPAVLLRADASRLADSEKIEIAQALLASAAREQAIDQGWQHHHLGSLVSPGLAAVVRPYLLSPRFDHAAARDLALDMVRECCLRDCADDLWQVIRNPNAKNRTSMANALRKAASEGFEAQWLEVLEGDIPQDEEGALLGFALDVLIPRHLKVREVLPHLIPERDYGNFIGVYTMLYPRLVQRMEKADALPVVIHSARHHAAGFGKSWRNEKESFLSGALRWLAEDLDEPEVMLAFAEWWRAATVNHKEKPQWKKGPVSLDELGFQSADRRRLMLVTSIEHARFSSEAIKDYYWFGLKTFVRLPEDVSWLIAQMEGKEPRIASLWAKLLSSVYLRPSSELDESLRHTLLDAFEHSKALRSQLPVPTEGRTILEEIALAAENNRLEGEQEAAKWRQRDDRRNRARLKRNSARFEEARREFDAGESRAWSLLAWALYYDRHPGGGGVDLTDVENIHTKQEPWMFAAARRFLMRDVPVFPPANENLSMHATWALFVLWKDLEQDSELAERAAHWMPHILRQVNASGWGHEDFTAENLLKRFQPHSITAKIAILKQEYLNQGSLWSINELNPVAAESVSQVEQMLLEHPPQPKGFRSALEWLANTDLTAAERVAAHWLNLVPFERLEAADSALFAASMIHLKGRLWPQIRPRIWNKPEHALKVLLTLFGDMGLRMSREVNLGDWPTDYLADITWLVFRIFPPKPGVHQRSKRVLKAVSTHDEAKSARSTLLQALVERGVPGYFLELESLGKNTQTLLRYLSLSSKLTKAQSDWQPVKPSDLLALAGGHDFRLVKTNDELLRAVGAALEEYERELQQSSGADLLNQDGSPKLEESLSGHLVRWLENRHQIFPIREKETSRGNREDITVCFNQPGKLPLSLCIEVKKDKSGELMQKMETQLLKQYLIDQQNRTHGLFVVFWFQDGHHSLLEVVEQLRQQAEHLSTGPYRLASKVIDCRSLPVPKSKARSATKKPKAKTTT